MPKNQYFDNKEKTLLSKAREAIAREEAGVGGGGGIGGGVAGGLRKGASVGAMFQKPFWKTSQDLNEDKVRSGLWRLVCFGNWG